MLTVYQFGKGTANVRDLSCVAALIAHRWRPRSFLRRRQADISYRASIRMEFNVYGMVSPTIAGSLSFSELNLFCRYADVLHEVKPVTSGYRVVLAFNLVAKGDAPPPAFADLDEHVKQLRHSLVPWLENPSPEFLVYPLDHQYTEASIRVNELKGTDLQRVQCMLKLQQDSNFKLCLASLEKLVNGGVDGLEPCDDYTELNSDGEQFHPILDTGEEYVKLKKVFDLEGTVIARDVQIEEETHLVSTRFRFNWPDKEDFEGWTGNEGAMTNHWYRVSQNAKFACHIQLINFF